MTSMAGPESTKKQVVWDALDPLPLAAHAVQHLLQNARRSFPALCWNGRA